ncbi:MAG: hypothetical protein N3I35_13720 [Clostridia bacterium]|nr:hypothetical protein [Clostridia bacterium]
MLDPNLTAIICISILALIPISIVSVVKFTNLKLKTEQIRADAMVKAEEIKARNQYEIEKLVSGNRTNSRINHTQGNIDDSYEDPYEKRKVRER